MSEWKEFTLADCINKMNQGVNTTTEKVSYTESGIKVIRAKNILDYKIDFEDIVFINNETYDRLSINVKPKKNDVLYTNIGSQLGSAALVTIDDDFITAWNVLRIQTNSSKLSPLYLVYLLNNPNIREDIRGYDSSSTMPFVSGKVLGAMKITIPPLPEQERIAEVLSSLDDKIDLLQRQNITLEEMAEILFRQWFVEEADDIAEILLSEISKHVKRSINPSKSPDQLFKHYSLPSFDNGRNPEIQFGRNILSNKYLIGPGQILISKLNPRTPRVWFINSCDNYSICSTEFQVYEPMKKEYTEFIYCLLKSNETRDILSGASSGTSGSHQRVNPEDINKLSIKRPRTEILYKFHQISSTWLTKIDNNSFQIKQLETLRDTLLPKLMSGEVNVN